jgi:hypothetical protein
MSDDDSLSDASISLDESSDSLSMGHNRDVEDSQRDDITGAGAVQVSRSRRMAIAMFLMTSALVVTTTYIFLSREETDEFEKSVSFCILRKKISKIRITTYQATLTQMRFVLQPAVHTKRKDYQGRCSVLRPERNECADVSW